MMQQSHCCLSTTPYREENSQKQTQAVAADLSCSSCCGRKRSSANILQLKSHNSIQQSRWVRAKLFQLIFQLCYYNTSSVRSLLGVFIWLRREYEPWTQRGNISVGFQPPPHPQSWDFSWKFLSPFRLLLSFPNLRKTLYARATSATRSTSLSRGI